MQVQEELKRFGSDMRYFDQHRDTLLADYPEQWVAIYHQQVVGAARDPELLLAQLQQQGIPRGRAFIDFITRRQDDLIL